MQAEGSGQEGRQASRQEGKSTASEKAHKKSRKHLTTVSCQASDLENEFPVIF